MEQYVIRGGNPLVGEVEIGGAKNAALAILTAATMTDETVLIENLPDVSDINVFWKQLQRSELLWTASTVIPCGSMHRLSVI